MQFTLFGIDFFPSERIFGIWFCGMKAEEDGNHMLLLYWNDGEFFIDVFWKRFILN